MTEALTLYVQEIEGALSEMRAYIRDHGLTRPKLGRTKLPISGVSYPVLTFTFTDLVSAMQMRLRFQTKLINQDTLNDIETSRRQRIGRDMKRLGVPPDVAKAVTRTLIEQTPLNLTRIR